MLDWMVVAGYFAVMLWLGWRSRHQSADSYWVADRQYRTRPITASLVATIFGASSTLGIIGLGYSRGLTGAWWSLVGGLALIPFGLFLAARVRALRVYTLPDILKKAYGLKVSIPAAVTVAVAWCGVVAAQMIAGARLVAGIFPLEYQLALGVVALVFITYTFWGGQISVIRTDSWQLALFLGGLSVCFVLLAASIRDGASFSGNVPNDLLRFPVSSSFGWYELLVFYPLVVGLPYLVGPDIYSRVLCARDDRVARRAALFAAAVIIPVSFLLAVVGLMARIHFPDIAAEAALPVTVSELVPVGVKGLIVAGFLAAVMSSADTTLMSASTIISLNVASPLAHLSEAQQLKLTKLALIVVGILAWLVAGFQQGIISSLLLGYTVFVGGVVLPALGSFHRQRLGITPAGAMWAVIVGGSMAMLGGVRDGQILRAILGEGGDALVHRLLGPQYPAILPVILSLVVMLGLSRVTRRHR
jgi:SSS family solute:Na+ symporter